MKLLFCKKNDVSRAGKKLVKMFVLQFWWTNFFFSISYCYIPVIEKLKSLKTNVSGSNNNANDIKSNVSKSKPNNNNISTSHLQYPKIQGLQQGSQAACPKFKQVLVIHHFYSNVPLLINHFCQYFGIGCILKYFFHIVSTANLSKYYTR